jgi:hypothetical protein
MSGCAKAILLSQIIRYLIKSDPPDEILAMVESEYHKHLAECTSDKCVENREERRKTKEILAGTLRASL